MPKPLAYSNAEMPGFGLVEFVGTVGTNDPDEWIHALWFCGRAYRAALRCDLVGHRPTLAELMCHFNRWQNDPRSPWVRLSVPAKPLSS